MLLLESLQQFAGLHVYLYLTSWSPERTWILGSWADAKALRLVSE